MFTIGTASSMSGVPAATIRTWEDRYGLVKPHRTGNRRRLYTSAEIELLRQVRARMEDGYTAGEAHRLAALAFSDSQA